jgi:P27 family predicted phage terminase small subunit
MAKMGRPKTPAPLNDLRGNPGKRPQSSGVRFPEGDVRCPDWLGEPGRAKWSEMVEILSPVDGLLKPAFGDLLALYCEAFEEVLDAKAEITKEGATCMSEKGGMYQHPAVGRKNKAIQRMRVLGGLFGMSPSDEAGLKIVGGVEGEETDPLILLMNDAG